MARLDEWDAEQRRLADLKRVPKSLVRHVGDIHDHAEPVELTNDVFTEIVQAAVLGLVVRRVCPVGIDRVREREVTDTEARVGSQNRKAVVDHVSAFHAEEHRDLAFAMGRAHVCPASTTFPGQRQLEFPVTYPSSSIT